MNPGLQRRLGLGALVAYGVGDILGAGIYALIGKIAGLAGYHVWIAFVLALVVAGFTAMSYAELGSRFPRSGGEATFCLEAFHREGLAFVVGWLVLCSGIVSMAAIARAFAGYLGALVPGIPVPVVIGGFILALTVLNLAGIRQTSAANILCTFIEAGGLLLVVGLGLCFWLSQEVQLAPEIPVAVDWPVLFHAGALAFFAFIGFEDMVNVAEEVKAPEGMLPKAIIVALSVAAVLYIAVSWVAVVVVPPAQLAESRAPLLEVVHRAAPRFPTILFVGIALFAVANTSLLNFVTASRLIYGMAREGLLPRSLQAVHPRRHTPHLAIAVVGVFALLLSLSGTLTRLAGATSTLILMIFVAVNGALIVIQGRQRSAPFRVSRPVPILGLGLSLGLLAFVPWDALVVAGVTVLAGLVLYWGQRRIASPKGVG